MKLVICGYTITAYAQRAANKFISEQVLKFTSADVANVILPYVRKTATSWPGHSERLAARSAADEIIRVAVARGDVAFNGRGARDNINYWKRVAR